jgi:type I restriction enzyme, S subunit
VPGSVRQQKYLFLIQSHLGINLGGRFVRGQYGPFDQSVYEIHRHAKTQYWFSSRHTKGEDVFTEGAGIGAMLEEARAMFGESLLLINSMTQLLNDLDTKEIEAVATLYAVWNDFILEGQKMPDKEEIILEAKTNWHKDKHLLSDSRLLELLEWMKLHGLEPRGLGQSTKGV